MARRTFPFCRALVLALMAAGAPASRAGTPVLFEGSDEVVAGRPFEVSGSGLSPRCRLEFRPRGRADPPAAPAVLDPIAASAASIIARAPADFDAPLADVVAECDGARSAPLRLGRIAVEFSPVERACGGQAFDLYGRFGDPRWSVIAQAERIPDGQRFPLPVLERERFRVRIAVPTGLPTGAFRLVLDSSQNGDGEVRVPVDAHPTLCRVPIRTLDPATVLGVPEADVLLAEVRHVEVHVATGLAADGTTDDRPRLQQLIDAHRPNASDRIAVLRLPAGRIALDVAGPGRALRVHRGMFLVGAPGRATTLVFGAAMLQAAPGSTPTHPEQRVVEFEGCAGDCALHPAGLVELALDSRNHRQYVFPRPPHVSAGIRAIGARGVVLAGLDWRMGHLETLELRRVREFLIVRSRFDNPTSAWSAFTFDRSRLGRVLDSTFRWFFGRFEAGVFTTGIELRGNRFTIDYGAQPDTTRLPHTTCCGGGLQLQGAFRQAYVGNRIEITGEDPSIANGYIAGNHGEMILAETHSTSILTQDGIVAAATADGLVDLAADWDVEGRYPTLDNGFPNPPPGSLRIHGSVDPFVPGQRLIVALATGRGTGQVRRLVGHTRQTLTLDAPWTVPPAPGDRYKLFGVSAEGVYLLDNEVVNGPSTVQIESALRVVIAGNRGVDSGRIKLEGLDRYSAFRNWTCRYLYPPAHPLANGLTPAQFLALGDCRWHGTLRDVRVVGNTLENTRGKYAVGIQIGASLFQDPSDPEFGSPLPLGQAIGRIEVRDNRLIAHAPRNVKEHETRALGFRFSDDWHWLGHERFYVVAGGSAKTFLNRFDSAAIDGVVLSGNRIERIDDTEPAHVLSHGIGALAIDDPAHSPPTPTCLDLEGSGIEPDTVVRVRIRDPARLRHRYLESCAEGPRCNERWRRDEVAEAVAVVTQDRRVRIDDPAVAFLVRWWRPLADRWTFVPLHRRFELARPFAIEVLDGTGAVRTEGFVPLDVLVGYCARLAEARFADGFEDG
jgi:hypothetical protein